MNEITDHFVKTIKNKETKFNSELSYFLISNM